MPVITRPFILSALAPLYGAICEYLADKFPAKHLWPADAALRAYARAVSAEMHSSFGALRSSLPMNIRNRYPGKGMTQEVASDVARIQSLFCECLAATGGPFLFGEFCIADAMYAPVVFRLRTYAVEVSGTAVDYVHQMLATPALVSLARLAEAEGHAQARYDEKYA